MGKTDEAGPRSSLAFGFFLAVLDSSIVATSMYAIAIEFHEIETINWVALAYTLSNLSCVVLFARISDVVGRRAAYLAAYFIFVAFSLACGFAQSLNQLIAFRALQGIGGSGLYSLTMIIFPEITPDKYQQYVAGIIGIVLAVSGVLGPLLGGILTQYATWRWVFWINGPIGGTAALIFLFAWPDEKYLPSLQRRKWKELDFPGAFLLVAAAVLIVFPFQNASTDGRWSEAIFLAPLLSGLASLAALFAWQVYLERRWPGKIAATIPLVLLRNRAFTATVLNTILMGFPYFVAIYVFPIRFQIVNGKSPLDAGLMLLPMLAATAIGSMVGGVINNKKNMLAETLMVAGIFMVIGCAAETTATSTDAVEPRVLGFLAFIGLGFGLSATASTMSGIMESPIREHASAQGLISQVRILGGSIGIAASSAVLGTKIRSSGSAGAEQLSHSGSGVGVLSPELQAAIRTAYTDALHEDMIVCCAVVAVGVLCAAGVWRRNRLPLQEQLKERYDIEAQRRAEVEASKAQGDAKFGV
ncbi:major facilitator superfamily transporter [Lasiosphaeria hispida]|uniref:Major facilitator superfamily transporter n=1 Tax=Lasiosphaeria hispida TaxID=260671 RepID=A0AAJ0HIZ7_9PEZI|nr:major facilitator superfamily transporter [Lasiosphaeria hispida]